MKNRQDRLKTHADSLQVTEYSPNDKEAVMGVSNNFSSPLLVRNLTSNFGLFENDEPVRIQALRIKGRTQMLNQKEKDLLQRHYYMQDIQADKDDRYVLGEGYRIGKKLVGLNAEMYNY